ncbi:hypothetical protein [Brevibacterium picturae]|uniref:DUF998 domain-containing protein n=1 Tax=Brevibacterium picturae TaxID=260553 RepID=A0ABN2CS45_9MICO
MSATAITTLKRSTVPRWVGVALMVGVVVNLAAEAVSASAWDVRPYSYADDYVNFLGSPFAGTFQGVQISSPLWFIMTTGWIITAVLIATAGIRFGFALRGRKAIAIATLSTIQGIALILFAVVPLTPETIDRGLLGVYLLGAFLSIIAGNALAILVGLFTRALGIPRPIRILSVTLGAIGLISIGATYGWAPIGIAERISVYTYLAWALITGLHLVTSRRRRR